MDTENISILDQFSETTSVTSSPEYTLGSSSDPSSVPTRETPEQFSAPDGSPVTANVIDADVSFEEQAGKYINIAEHIQPLRVVAGTQPQLPFPSPSADGTIPSYQFYQYEAITQNPASTLQDIFDQHGAGSVDNASSAAQFVHRHVAAFEQSWDQLAGTSDFISAAEALPTSGGAVRILRDAVAAGVGGTILAEAAGVGAAIGVGTLGATLIGGALVVGGVIAAYDDITGKHVLGNFLENATSTIREFKNEH